MKRFTLLKTMLLLCALIVGSGSVWGESLTIDFEESSAASYTNWTFTNFTTQKTNSNVPAHGGSYFGTTGGKETGSVVTKQKIASPTSITFYISKQTTNTTSSSWLVKVSSDGQTWTTVGDAQEAASGITRGTWYEVTRNLSSYKNVYVGVFYDGSTAVRTIDDLTLTYSNPSLTYWIATYDYNDGVTANKEVHVDKTTEAASYTLEAAPSRSNFTFMGWNDGTNNYDGGADYPMTIDKIFTAQWEYAGPCTKYNKSSKSDLATGAQYILVGDKSGTNHFANNDIASGHLYFSSSAVSNANSSITNTKAIIVDEEPLVLTLEETADGWYLKNSDGDKLGMTGDKQMDWNSGDMTWVLGGSDDVPTFSANNSNKTYILKYNSSATRFNGYESGQAATYFYRLDNDKNVYTLTLDFNDDETAAGTHRVLEGASYTLTAPTREGYTFGGWNTAADGSGTNYAAGAYTMPAANTTLYAVWAVSVTVTDAKYATFCSPYKLDYSGTGVKVYMAKSTDSSVKLTEVEDGIVPANAGVVLYSETANTYNIPVTSAAGSDYDAEKNELVGINVRTSVAADGGEGKTNYILSNEDAGVGFYKAKTSGAYLAAHRAYLSTTGAAASRSFLGFDDETTGIETINTNPETVSGVQEYYNLNGQRVTAPTKGLYIVNGKKVIINK